MNYNTIPSDKTITNTAKALSEHNFDTEIVNTKEEALAKIKELISQGASVMSGASVTLEEIGYINFLKEGKHGWNNLHETVLLEKDKVKQIELRKQSVLSDYYIGSAHSITETGEIVVASNSGSQLPHLVFTSNNIILVVGAQKITSNLTSALERVEKYVVGLEDERMKKVYGFGTTYAKTLILHKENPMMGRKIKVIIVKEKLGF